MFASTDAAALEALNGWPGLPTYTTGLGCRTSRRDDENGRCSGSSQRARRSGSLSTHSHVHNYIQFRRHSLTAIEHRAAHDAAFHTLREIAGVAFAA